MGNKLGPRIRDYRIAAGLTQTELADKLHTSKQTIYKYESGIVTNIPLDKIEELALVFGVEPVVLLGWEKSSSANSLPPDEQTLLNLYCQLNDEGKMIARNSLTGLLASGMYLPGEKANRA